MLWRVFAYCSPGLPSPTTIFSISNVLRLWGRPYAASRAVTGGPPRLTDTPNGPGAAAAGAWRWYLARLTR